MEPFQLKLDARTYVMLAGLASAAMLGAAHAFERIGGYEPCALCLQQREIYWTVLAASVTASVLSRLRPEVARVAPFLLAALFATGALIAGFHAGVELKWWPMPAGCGGAGPADAAGMASILRGDSKRLVLCDEAAWSMWGLSMAGWNALISTGLAALGVWAGARGDKRLRALEAARA